jgi:DNA helicase-2/ATP-dependent DNA helicase PcrA
LQKITIGTGGLFFAVFVRTTKPLRVTGWLFALGSQQKEIRFRSTINQNRTKSMGFQSKIFFEKELNPQQLKVVQSDSGPILVIAGAGSGKTRTLTYRVAYLIEAGIDPYGILLVTFTNKAAREMLNRVASLIPQDTKKIWGGTFHHIANRILRVHAVRLGLQPNYTILDQHDSGDLLNACLVELGYKQKKGLIPQGGVLSHIFSLARNTRSGLEAMLEQRYPYFVEYTREICTIQEHYTSKKNKLNLMDFDDLLCYWLRLLEEDPAIKDSYARRFQHVLVDEYQDTNRLQADIIDLIASYHQNLMVVGDDSQSIYAFRGANFSNIIDFPKRYPQAKIYKLEYNYRSSAEILHLANESIMYNEKQFPKLLKPVKGKGAKPFSACLWNVLHQARRLFLLRYVRESASSNRHTSKI